MNAVTELKLSIAASIYLAPCTILELKNRDICKNMSIWMIDRMVFTLEKDAVFYTGDVMHVRKKWAMDNLKDYDIDFRTDKQKYTDSLSSFAKQILNMNKLIVFFAFIFITSCGNKTVTKPSVWIEYWHPKDKSHGGHHYNDLIKLNDRQYLYVGKDGFGNTFDSSIITINP